MIILGLTGPSGSGKSTASKLLEQQGFKHIDTDKISREIIPKVLTELIKTFGRGILTENGALDRKKLAASAFSSPENTSKLNKIMHPQIMKEVQDIINEAKANGYKGAVVDGAAIIEAGACGICDKTITIYANDKDRINRVIKRDNITEEEALIRFGGQKPLSYYIDNTDYSINNENREFLEQRLIEIINDIKS